MAELCKRSVGAVSESWVPGERYGSTLRAAAVGMAGEPYMGSGQAALFCVHSYGMSAINSSVMHDWRSYERRFVQNAGSCPNEGRLSCKRHDRPAKQPLAVQVPRCHLGLINGDQRGSCAGLAGRLPMPAAERPFYRLLAAGCNLSVYDPPRRQSHK